MNEGYTCELCKRSNLNKITEHHLTPREEGGANMPVAWLCVDCHKQIHALYDNKELAVRLNSIDALENDDKIEKYLKYIRKQPVSKNVNVKKSNNIRKKRR